MGFSTDKKFDIVIGNPPYDRNLHLKVMELALSLLKENGKGCFIHPARWYEDNLAILNQKSSSDFKKFNESIVEHISDVDIINVFDATKLFKDAQFTSDLMLTHIDMSVNNETTNISNKYNFDVLSIINKIFDKSNLFIGNKAEVDMLEGHRVKISKLQVLLGSNLLFRAPVTSMSFARNYILNNGYNKNGIFHTEIARKNQHTKPVGSTIPWSIRFDTEQQAQNFIDSYANSKFMWNLQYMLQTDQNVPLNYLPYIIDETHGEYEKPWTDEDYCEYFGLNEEESKFMCRKVDDYRIKDFINYCQI